MSVGAVSDAVARYMVEQHPGIGDEHDVIIPVVGECDDSWLNDITGRHVEEEHVREAIDRGADGPVAEGAWAAAPAWSPATSRPASAPRSRKLPEVVRRLHAGRAGDVATSARCTTCGWAGMPVGEVLAEKFRELPRREHSYGSHHRGGGHRRAAAAAPDQPPVQAGGAGHRPGGELRRARLGGDRGRLLHRQRHSAAHAEDGLPR